MIAIARKIDALIDALRGPGIISLDYFLIRFLRKY